MQKARKSLEIKGLRALRTQENCHLPCQMDDLEPNEPLSHPARRTNMYKTQQKNDQISLEIGRFTCRSGGIRTRGLLVPNQTRYQTALHLDITGADEGTRTPDLLITNRLLYHLSHIGMR